MGDVPPLALDIDGTLTRPAGPGIDPRVFDPLRDWEAPVVLATGKAFPYPIALCHFIGIPEIVVAENGGVVHTGRETVYLGDREGPASAVAAYERAGHATGWGENDTVNRWRETEVAVNDDQPEEALRALVAEHGAEVVDSGYAFHVKSPDVSKGDGLELLADRLDLELDRFVAVGDSANDVETFAVVGRSYAVGNADAVAREAADECLEAVHADGTLSVLQRLLEEPTPDR